MTSKLEIIEEYLNRNTLWGKISKENKQLITDYAKERVAQDLAVRTIKGEIDSLRKICKYFNPKSIKNLTKQDLQNFFSDKDEVPEVTSKDRYDLFVKLNSIENGIPSITIKAIDQSMDSIFAGTLFWLKEQYSKIKDFFIKYKVWVVAIGIIIVLFIINDIIEYNLFKKRENKGKIKKRSLLVLLLFINTIYYLKNIFW